MTKVISKLFVPLAMKKLTNSINKTYINNEIYDNYYEFLDFIWKYKIDISLEEKDEFKKINCSLFKKIIDENIDDLIKKI